MHFSNSNLQRQGFRLKSFNFQFMDAEVKSSHKAIRAQTQELKRPRQHVCRISHEIPKNKLWEEKKSPEIFHNSNQNLKNWFQKRGLVQIWPRMHLDPYLAVIQLHLTGNMQWTSYANIPLQSDSKTCITNYFIILKLTQNRTWVLNGHGLTVWWK